MQALGTGALSDLRRVFDGVALTKEYIVTNHQPTGPFCQSCGMPMEKPDDFGTAAEGFRINDYCHYCFRDGTFTEPAITMQEMIDKCVSTMARQGIMPAAQASSLMADVIPRLKRWR